MDSTKRKETARDSAVQYIEEYFEQPLSKITDYKKRSFGMLKWYVEAVHNVIELPLVDEEAIEESIVDEAGDLGGDFLYYDDAAEIVLLIQAKWRNDDTKNADRKDVQDFVALLNRYRSAEWRAKTTPRIRRLLAGIRWDNVRVDMRFVSLGKFDNQAALAVKEAQQQVASMTDIDANLQCLGAEELNKKYRYAVKMNQALPGPQEFFATVCEEVDNSWLLVVEGPQIKALYQSGGGDALFNQNIRGYVGSTEINKDIARTIREYPENFYYFNNGISCLVTDFKEDAEHKRRLRVSGLQVINGAQTVRAIANAETDLSKVKVLMRITKRREDPEDPFINQIVRNNNSQNAVKDQDFVSNDGVQVQLRKQFATYKRLAKEVRYLPKRGEDASAKYENIKIVDFAKRIHSFVAAPVDSISALFDSTKRPYRLVFGNGEQVYTAMPDREFRYRSGIWWMSVEFESARKQDKKSGKYVGACDKLGLLLHTARGLLVRNVGTDGHYRLLEAHYNGNFSFASKDESSKFFLRLYEESRSVLVDLYSEAADRDGDMFSPTEWRRSSETLKHIERKCSKGHGSDILSREFESFLEKCR